MRKTADLASERFNLFSRMSLVPLTCLALLLSGCGGNSEVESNQSAKVDAAIAKACDHFQSDGNVTDIFGMEKDFSSLAKIDIQYLRLAELATGYIEDFGKAIDNRVGKPSYPKVPRLLENFCKAE